MSTQGLFSKKNIQAQHTETGRGLLEELNLPPGLITFIRTNARSLQIGLICVVMLILAWIFYDYYAGTQEQKGASLLASAMQAESAEQKIQTLQNVISEYGGTDAARWSRLELAHTDYREGDFEAAAAKYKDILDDLSADNSLVPLTRLNLAQSYEQAAQYDQAITQYNLLKKSTGFTDQAYLGLGRSYLAKEDPAQARKAYEELLGTLEETPDAELKSLVEAKLVSLDAGSVPAPSQSGDRE